MIIEPNKMPVSRLLRARYICNTAINAPDAKMTGTRKYALWVNGFHGFFAADVNKASLSSSVRTKKFEDCPDSLDRSELLYKP